MLLCIAFSLVSSAHSAPISQQNGSLVVSKASHGPNQTLAASLPERQPQAAGDGHLVRPGGLPYLAQEGTAVVQDPARRALRGHHSSRRGDDTDPFECLHVRNGSAECLPYVNYEQRSFLEKRLAIAREHKAYFPASARCRCGYAAL